METTIEKCPADGKAAFHHIRACHDEQRRANEHVINHLRQLILKRSQLSFGHEQREIARKSRQLERAFELYEEAEAKIQILLTWLGGGI
jgi:hypothetical protein